MAIRPNKKPRWANVPTINSITGKNNVIEPSEAKKDLGFDYLEKAARNTMNWVLNKAYEWIDYFDQNTSFLVLENTVPDLSFKLQGGNYFTQGTILVTIADVTLGPLVAPTVNPRIDRVILNKLTGVISITTGVEAGSPVPVALLTNEIALSQIALVVAQTEIVNADITDERPLWDTVLDASLTDAGVSELSTDAEAIAKADATRSLTPSNLAALDASLTFRGMIEQATDAEAIVKTDTTRSLSPSNLAALGASVTVQGLVETSTNAEAQAGTDTIRYLTPSNLATMINYNGVETGFIKSTNIYLSDDGVVNNPFDVDAVIGSSFETIGPTASGATNIWTALDGIPLGATGVLLRSSNQVDGSTNADSYASSNYLRESGSALGLGVTSVSIVQFDNRSGSNEQGSMINDVWIPLDSSNIFEIAHTVSGTSPTDAAQLKVVGFTF